MFNTWFGSFGRDRRDNVHNVDTFSASTGKAVNASAFLLAALERNAAGVRAVAFAARRGTVSLGAAYPEIE